MENNVDLAAFQEMLNRHDWYYGMSHDIRVWERGKESEKKILSLVKKHVFYEDMYNQKREELKLNG